MNTSGSERRHSCQSFYCLLQCLVANFAIQPHQLENHKNWSCRRIVLDTLFFPALKRFVQTLFELVTDSLRTSRYPRYIILKTSDMANIEGVVENAVLAAAENVEKQLDEELDRLNNLKDDDLEAIRRKRMAEMRKEAEQKVMWKRNGHGSMQHITEKEFFARAKSCERMVAIMYRAGSSRYADDLVAHISRVAERHLETLFVTLDAEKSMFLCTKLQIRILPSLILVKDSEIDRLLLGLDQISSTGKFSTKGIEKRLFDFQMLTDTNIADDA